MKLIAPTVHMNGTSGAHLVDGYTSAIDALYAAVAAVHECAPDGRDYYPQGDEVYRAARLAHGERVAALGLMICDLGFVRDAVQKQIDAKDSRRKSP